MDYQILSDAPNGLTTRSVWLLMKNGNDVRRIELIAASDEDLTVTLPPRLSALFDAGTAEAEGLRVWFAVRQRLSDELLDQTIFTVFGLMQNNVPLATMTQAGVAKLATDPFQSALYTQLKTVFDAATEQQRHDFIALALTVAYGKLGQR